MADEIKQVAKWIAKPAQETFFSALRGALRGALAGVSTHFIVNQVLSVHPEYEPFLKFFTRPVLEHTRNLVVANAAMEGLSSVVMKLRGKEELDAQTCMVAVFGTGLLYSSITGSRGREVFSDGVMSSLMWGGAFDVITVCRKISKRLKSQSTPASVAFPKSYLFAPTRSSSLVIPETHNDPAFMADEIKQGKFAATLKSLQNWLAILIKNTIDGAVTGAIDGFCLRILFDVVLDPIYPSSLDSKFFSSLGGYRPLIQSLLVGPRLELARNCSVALGTASGICGVMKKLRGEEDVPTCMVAFFGSGVALSLVTGVRWPEAISVGFMLALAVRGVYPMVEKLLEDDKTNSSLDHHATNFNTGFFTSNALSLQPTDDHRKEAKKGGKRTWFYR